MKIPILDPKQIEQLSKEDPEFAAQLARQYRKAMIVLARTDPSWFCQYVLKEERGGGPIVQHPDHEELQRTVIENSRVAVWTHPGYGKALPINTEIPTTYGWKLMKDIKVGDHVYGSDGRPALVSWVGDIEESPKCYKLTFDDRYEITASAEHLWLARRHTDRLTGKFRVVSTEEMASMVRTKDKEHRLVWCIPKTEPVAYAEQELPVPAYVLGAWLGDGDSAGPHIAYHEDDRYIYDLCSSMLEEPGKEYRIKSTPHIFHSRLGGRGFSKALRSLGVTGKAGCKFIPEIYLRGSIQQRMDLLCGLLDTDGCVYKRKGPTSFIEVSFCVEKLATDTLELIRSLGFKARMTSSPSKIYGVVKGIRHRIFFTAHSPVFRLPRKLAMQGLETPTNSQDKYRHIEKIELTESVPSRCIRVESPDHTFLATRSYTVTHNCEVRGAKILLADGSWQEIQNLNTWTKVLTWGGGTDLIEVTAKSSPNGMKQVRRIKLSNGVELKVTLNHPLMKDIGGSLNWVPAEEVRVGNSIAAVQRIDIKNFASEAESGGDEAEILGYLFMSRIQRGAVIVRRITHPKWEERRKNLFAAAGWYLEPHERNTYVVRASPGSVTPNEFIDSWCVLDNGTPVDFVAPVWKLSDLSLQRLLTGVFVNAFHRARQGCPMAGYVDGGVPLRVGTTRRAAVETLGRLLLRFGVRSVIGRYEAFPKIAKNPGGLWLRQKEKRVDIWSIKITKPEVYRFWPSNNTVAPAPLIQMLKVTEAKNLPGHQETWAIEVQEKEHSYISSGVLSHNTNQISIGYVLWRIGKDPNCAIAIMTNTAMMANRIVGALKQYIAHSPEFRDVFPDVRPGEKWSESSFTVTRETIRKDPTVQAVGLTGQIVGARLEGLVIDDIDNVDTVHTAESRDQVEKRVREQALSRLDDNGWCVAIGNIWHENDCMHRLAWDSSRNCPRPGWAALRYPIIKSDGEPRDPEKFPLDRCYHIRDVDQGPLQFARLYMLRARIDGEQRFRTEWIEGALNKGIHQVLMKEGIHKTPAGCRTLTGVDLGIKQKASSDPTCITTILEIPKADKTFDYVLLNIIKGRWNAQEIMDKIVEQQRFFDSEVFVESNGGQDFLIQLMNLGGAKFKVNPFFTTSKNKFDPSYGIESIAAEMAMGRWTLPSYDGTREQTDEETDELIEEMLAYTPGNHTGDILMSLWIAREGGRTSRGSSTPTVEFGSLRLRR